MEAGIDENGPKQCETRRLGHWYVIFFSCFFNTNWYI